MLEELTCKNWDHLWRNWFVKVISIKDSTFLPPPYLILYWEITSILLFMPYLQHLKNFELEIHLIIQYPAFPLLSRNCIWRSFNSSPCPLPQKLKKLSFGNSFNVSIDKLPPGLVELHFGDNGVLPLDIEGFYYTQIDFNHPLPPLPNTLTTLTLGQSYSHTINAEGTSLQTFCGSYHLLRPASLTHVVARLDLTLLIPASLSHLHLLNVNITSPI